MTGKNAEIGAISRKLAGIYRKYGYLPYKMSRFEEYELYMRNKEFLISDQVITFTDTNGRLMALKPDVTLSVIRNIDPEPGQVAKVYYSENVYRVSGRSGVFSELMQTGLEAIGAVDNVLICEVLHLAAESLNAVSDSWVLDVTGLDILTKALDGITQDEGIRKELLECVGRKNPHGLKAIAQEKLPEAEAEKIDALSKLAELYGAPAKVLAEAEALCKVLGAEAEFKAFAEILSGFGAEAANGLRVDFSAVSDMNYYNGIVFRGFVEGVPERVLSGGQYDRLMEKLSRRSRALGFAVYLDALERVAGANQTAEKPDVDAVLCYRDTAMAADVWKALEELTQICGGSARAVPETQLSGVEFTYGRLFSLRGGALFELKCGKTVQNCGETAQKSGEAEQK